MKKEIEELIYSIQYGQLEQDIDFFNNELLKKVLLIYVDETNNTFNLPSNFLDEIITKIKNIDEQEL